MTERDSDITADADTDPARLRPRPGRSVYLRREPLSAETIARLRDEAERTGIGAMQLLRGAKDKPAGLTASVVGVWLSGKVQSAVPAHVEYVLKRWAGFPTNRRLPLTPEMRAELAAEFARTGMGPVQILKRANDIPLGLSHQMIQAWTSDRPKPGTVGEAYWTYVLARLRALPDGEPFSTRSGQAARLRKVDISAGDLAELRHHRERTGIGGAVLLRNARDKPQGLTPAMISGWLSNEVKRADEELIAFVLARYRAWP